MIKHYQHTQIGYLIMVILIIGIFFLAYLLTFHGFVWIIFIITLIFGFCLILFATLTVIIKEEILEIRFGPGFIRKKFLLKDIESCQVVKNPWYYGWGIRVMPNGMLYNVSGLYAVEIKMKTGQRHRIGTNVPNELEKAILQFTKQH